MTTALVTAEKLFETALAKVESKSIREWATSERNRPLFLQWISVTGTTDTDKIVIYIVSNAIGGW